MPAGADLDIQKKPSTQINVWAPLRAVTYDVQPRAVVILMSELSGIGSYDFIACEMCDDTRSGSEN